ncbi:MAG: sugar transferase [Oscillospiraceae bacterium]|nr:sugar transferase [Oscillospiraceae bacterium]
MYRIIVKRFLDVLLSLLGLLLLPWVFLLIAAAIFIDDPGPVFFRQKRVGLHKKTFMLHKFRSMRRSTPHDMPTHLLENPEQYITRVGRFLRRSSLDELPQIWDIFVGNMSIVGPRPALWNQEDLIAERDRYGANELRPGLTGWAQINGRDELEIPEKARLDGEYAAILKRGGLRAFGMDVKCFFGTLKPVATAKGVVEGAAPAQPLTNNENK